MSFPKVGDFLRSLNPWKRKKDSLIDFDAMRRVTHQHIGEAFGVRPEQIEAVNHFTDGNTYTVTTTTTTTDDNTDTPWRGDPYAQYVTIPATEITFEYPGVTPSGVISLGSGGMWKSAEDFSLGPFLFKTDGTILFDGKPMGEQDFHPMQATLLVRVAALAGLGRPSELYHAMNTMYRAMLEIRDTCPDCEDHSCNRCRIIDSALEYAVRTFQKVDWALVQSYDTEVKEEDK